MTDLKLFQKNVLEPALFENINSAFPDMGFTRSRNGKVWNSRKHLDGADSSDGNGCYISEGRWSNRIADRNGSRCKSISLIDFQAKRMGLPQDRLSGADYVKVLDELCKVCGLILPQYEREDSEQYKEYLERQEALFAICEEMKEALFTDEGAETLRYLKEQRGYSEELIRSMGLGCLTEKTQEELRKLGLLSDVPHKEQYYKPVSYYRLAIPYISRGTIRGVKFRTLGGQTFPDGDKVNKYHNTNGKGLKSELFGVSGARLSGVGSERDVIVVEGELDALRAQAQGLLYVVAATGGDLQIEALSHLRSIGAEKVTLLFDTPQRGSQDEKTLPSKISDSLTKIREAGLSGYVAKFPEREDGEKVDLDSFLRDYPIESVKEITDSADSEILWRYAQAQNMFSTTEPTIKDFEKLKKETLRLCNCSYCTPTDRGLLFRLFENGTGNIISQDDIREEADALKAEQDRAQKEAQTKTLLSQAQELIGAGKTEEALLLMKNGSGQLGRINKEAEYSHYLEDRTDALWEEYKAKPKGLKTNITLRSGKDSYSLILPSGAISIIGAATGNGKSKTLQSLAIEAATNGEEGVVLYITYEENEKNVNRQFLNSYCNIELTKESARFGNEQTLQEYLYNGNTQYIKGERLKDFESKLSEYKELRRSALRIVKPEDNYLETLLGFLSYATGKKSGVKVKAVFVDYVQELYIEALKRNTARPDELKEIMVELDLVAQRADVPVVMGAQLSRNVKSPLSFSNQDIADSAWIERKASEILLLWSSLEKPKEDNSETEFNRVKRELPQLSIGEGGKLYAKLTKSRFIPKGADTILSINGNTGRVSAGTEIGRGTQAEQRPICFTPDTF